MTVFPYATQQTGWEQFATDLDSAMAGLDPAVLMPGQSGGLISEHIDALYVLQKSGVGLADSASALAGVCAQQDGYDHELASNPVTKERVEEAEDAARKARAMLRAGQCEPEVAELVIARADELAQQRQEAIDKHAEQTSETHFDEPESVEWPDAHYPGRTEGEPGKKGGDDGTPFGDFNGEDQPPTEPGETPEPGDKPKSPFEPETPPLQAPMHPEPGSSKYMTPMPEPVTPLPETVTPETTLSRGDAALVSPSSNVLGQQTPQAQATTQQWPQQPQYTGISQPNGRMLGNVNPQNAPNSRKDRHEPEGTRPVPAETLAAVAATPVATAPTHATATSPNVSTPSTPGTHTSAANVPTSPSAPSTPSGSNLGPTPMSTVGPGSRASVTGGGMREKPSVPDTLRAVLSEETVRDLEKALSNAFPDPEPPNTDPVPTGALR